MSNQTEPKERFKKNIISLYDAIVDMYKEAAENNIVDINSTKMALCGATIKIFSAEKMINNFILKTNEYWDKILEKDLEYFKNMGISLFSDFEEKGMNDIKNDKDFKESGFADKIGEQEVKDFHKVLSGTYKSEDGEHELEVFDDDKKQEIWTIMYGLVKTSIIHIHEKRHRVDGKYMNHFFPSISIKKNVQKWKIKSISFD